MQHICLFCVMSMVDAAYIIVVCDVNVGCNIYVCCVRMSMVDETCMLCVMAMVDETYMFVCEGVQ